ncbi:MAG: DUF3098 domain-containing protein [Bacteroidia bacterium]|nr:DUF3098 domain-containing protein [Bacteroidia bacterium]MDW8157653.1 DUF3098 domain-containing protein [Bacteroidia bacterium]
MNNTSSSPKQRRRTSLFSEPASQTISELNTLPFGRKNYIYLIISVGILLLGFFLLSVEDKFIDAFKVDAQGKAVRQFSIALHVAPIVIIAGYIGIIFAILAPGQKEKNNQASTKPTETP